MRLRIQGWDLTSLVAAWRSDEHSQTLQLGRGHRRRGSLVTGALVIVAAYTASLLFVEWLFAIVKPKLMTLIWFARVWTWLASLRAVRWLTAIQDAVFHVSAR